MFKILNILRLFFEEPNCEFNVREVARISKIAPATASKNLKKLNELHILQTRQERTLKLYKANIESDSYRDLKVYYSIRKIKTCGLIAELNKTYLKPTIILFGSTADGLDTETSDFDFVIISETTKEFPKLKKFEQLLGRKLQIFAVTDLKEIKNKHLINNILNGLVLQGAIKWI